MRRDGVAEERAAAWLDAECRNLVAVTVAAATDAGCVLLADALRGYFRLRRRPAEWAVVAAAGLAAARRRADPAGLAAALLTAAALHLAVDDYRSAVRDLQEAARQAEEAGWAAGRAEAAVMLGNAYRLDGQLGLAARQLRHARTLDRPAEPVEDVEGRARRLYKVGLLAHERGRLPSAARCFGQALALHEGVGCGPGHLAAPVLALGDVHRQLGRLEEAGQGLDRALHLHRVIGDRTGEAYTLRCLAELHRDRDEPAAALSYALAAHDLACTLDDRRTEAQALQTRATVQLRLGRTSDAIAGHLRALQLATRIGNNYTAVEALIGLAEAYRRAGEDDRAQAHARDARRLARRTGYQYLESEAARALS